MRAEAAMLMALLLAGCGDQSMTQQPRYTTYAPAKLWKNGTSARPIPAGTIARDDDPDAAKPPPLTAAMMQHGQEQYDIFCMPCHARSGDGNGIVVQRGFPRPAPLSAPAQRAASAQHLYDVITAGYGVMYPFASRIAPPDRWAIVAYIRALQLSQRTALADFPDAERKLR
jgi:mono/diheme cytochrome c family protein